MRFLTAYAAAAAAIAIGVGSGLAARADTLGQPAMPGVHDGAYVGLLAGINAAQIKAPDSPSLADTGYFGGGYIGYGRAIDGTYLGIEADALLRDVKPGVSDGVASVTMSTRWMGSVRGRVGMPIGPALLYGTGGLAIQESVLEVKDVGLDASDKNYVFGAVFGGGIEAKLTNTMHIRVEGLHYAWQDETFKIDGYDAKIGQTDTVIRFGVGFKLN